MKNEETAFMSLMPLNACQLLQPIPSFRDHESLIIVANQLKELAEQELTSLNITTMISKTADMQELLLQKE